jgi:alkanesulfonate monooxygenase SsuD/methylene tetrahydromethanopterin reductase-like flavin-dependent oxidoreductase (luciferase family)
LFLADTTGGHDTYEGKLDECIRRAAQWPVTDPTIVSARPCRRDNTDLTFWQPISAMAAVTKNLAFGITASTSFEQPFLLAKRFSTLDHLTNGRVGWNIVTSYKKAAFKAIGLDSPIEHDQRYRQADEYLRVLYKFVFIPSNILIIHVDHFQTTDSGKALGHRMRSPPTPRPTRTSIRTRSARSTITESSTP